MKRYDVLLMTSRLGSQLPRANRHFYARQAVDLLNAEVERLPMFPRISRSAKIQGEYWVSFEFFEDKHNDDCVWYKLEEKKS